MKACAPHLCRGVTAHRGTGTVHRRVRNADASESHALVDPTAILRNSTMQPRILAGRQCRTTLRILGASGMCSYCGLRPNECKIANTTTTAELVCVSLTIWMNLRAARAS